MQYIDGTTYLVSGWHPSALLHHLCNILVYLWRSLRDLLDSRLFPRSRSLNIAQRLLQLPQLDLNLALCLLRVLHGDLFEALNSFNLLVHVVGLGLEGLEVVLDLVDYRGVLQERAIVPEVDGLGLVLEDLEFAAGVIVAFFEGSKGRGGAAA